MQLKCAVSSVYNGHTAPGPDALLNAEVLVYTTEALVYTTEGYNLKRVRFLKYTIPK